MLQARRRGEKVGRSSTFCWRAFKDAQLVYRRANARSTVLVQLANGMPLAMSELPGFGPGRGSE